MSHFIFSHFLFFISVLNIHVNCNSTNIAATSDAMPSTSAYNLQYDLENPDHTLKMPEKLNEISGITLSTDEKHLLAVEDEHGIVYTVDKSTGDILKETVFWKNGDFEDLTLVKNDVFVLKSSGTLYHIKDFETKQGTTLAEGEVIKYNNFSSSEYDIEGLVYDAKHHRLLLACKEEAEQTGRYRSVYSFNLATTKLEERPAFLISQKSIDTFLSENTALKQREEIASAFDPASSKFKFGPSAIAVHPHTGDYYILSSVGKMLIITDHTGTILHIEKLSKNVHAQPEGICFEPDGTLYISNEGKKGTARIYRFDVKNG